MRILVLEPYDGGSHRRFLDELTRKLDVDAVRLSLPARAWKWRMRFASVAMADAVAALPPEHRACDLVLASSFLDLATFRSIAPDSLTFRPHVLYFHENQFAYPNRIEDERDHHFGITQLLSALAADRCLFNSGYNLDSFLDAAEPLLKKAPDMKLEAIVRRIRARSRVYPVPLDLEAEPPCRDPRPEGPPIVLWNHRWEHDKNPESFFAAVEACVAQGIDFQVAVAGQQFRESPAIFEEARARLGDRILHFGYCESREEYLALLRSTTVCVSTANHEFQGLAVLEAAAQGAHVLLPDRLAYPELFPDLPGYRDDQELTERLAAILRDRPPVDQALVDRALSFGWTELGPNFQDLFERLAGL
jgi:glycosyltransferase involved in cell wall biosynthesis